MQKNEPFPFKALILWMFFMLLWGGYSAYVKFNTDVSLWHDLTVLSTLSGNVIINKLKHIVYQFFFCLFSLKLSNHQSTYHCFYYSRHLDLNSVKCKFFTTFFIKFLRSFNFEILNAFINHHIVTVINLMNSLVSL